MEAKTTTLTYDQVEMMKHAWGFRERSPGYRTHYCTELTDPDMLFLVESGFFSDPIGQASVREGYGIFHLTPKAISTLEQLKKQENEIKRKKGLLP